MPGTIDRRSPVPFYHQLKLLVVEHIRERGLRPGDRVPGEFALCEEYAVSRTVVRQALAELETEGVLERVKGRGTFVAVPKTTEGLAQHLTGLFEDVRARGHHLRSVVRRMLVEPSPMRVAEELGIEEGAPVLMIERLRFVRDEPWVLATTYLNAALERDLRAADLENGSLYEILEKQLGISLVSGRRTIEAAPASRDLAKALGMAVGAPVLVLRSTSLGLDGRPVEHFVAYHRGDRSRFEVELTRGEQDSRTEPLMFVTE
jgi:GntR family transcriptional regulator